MTEQKLREQAELRYEREQEEQRRREDAEREAEKERGIRGHIEEIQKQRDEERQEQIRREAEAEAEEIARERYELEQRIEAEAMAVNRSIAELEALDRRQRDALHRAGRPLGHDNSLSSLLPRWFAHRFGGFNSVTGVPGGHPNGKERPLAEPRPDGRRPDRGGGFLMGHVGPRWGTAPYASPHPCGFGRSPARSRWFTEQRR